MSRTRTALLALPAAALLALVPSSASAYPNPGTVTGSLVTHDPTMIRTSSGQYLLYATGGGIASKTSGNRIAFDAGADAFSSRPGWWSTYSSVPEAWAPDISYHGGKYLLYYSVSKFGSNTSAIGLATSSTGRPGSWSDQGIVYTSSSSTDYNAIDPNLFVNDDGKWWLSFGSWWTGIKMIQLNPSTGKQLAGNTTRYSLASRPTGTKAVEAPYIVKRGSYYYLFASYDTCCLKHQLHVQGQGRPRHQRHRAVPRQERRRDDEQRRDTRPRVSRPLHRPRRTVDHERRRRRPDRLPLLRRPGQRHTQTRHQPTELDQRMARRLLTWSLNSP